MILDMHCHTSEGSPDAHVSIHTMVDILKEKGYDGAVVTDHNSYKGYETWVQSGRDDFLLFKGVEYDTKDAGHILIILPSKVETDLFTKRGLKLKDLIAIVHKLGGILGPAHPFDYYRLGICNNTKWLRYVEVLRDLDFIETFNSCGRTQSNRLASMFCEFLNIPCVGGSDSHRSASVGMGATVFSELLPNEDALIEVIKSGDCKTTLAIGEQFTDSAFVKQNPFYCAGLQGYWALNAVVSTVKQRKLNRLVDELSLNIDLTTV